MVFGRRDCCLTGEPSVWWFVQGEIVDWWGSHQCGCLWKERLLTDEGAINLVVCERRDMTEGGAISEVVCAKRDCWLMVDWCVCVVTAASLWWRTLVTTLCRPLIQTPWLTGTLSNKWWVFLLLSLSGARFSCQAGTIKWSILLFHVSACTHCNCMPQICCRQIKLF